MYAALWRAVLCLVLVLAVVAVCFDWLFPLVSEHLPFTDNTVGAGGARRRAPWSA